MLSLSSRAPVFDRWPGLSDPRLFLSVAAMPMRLLFPSLLFHLLLLLFSALPSAPTPLGEAAAAAAHGRGLSAEGGLLLPRPLVVEHHLSSFPSVVSSDGERGRMQSFPSSSSCGGSCPEQEAEGEEVRLKCDSRRVAGEANNLAPWRTVPGECAGHVEAYMAGRAYRSDLEMVAREAAAYARGVRLAGDGRDAWVFDIDETLLSNLPYYADHQYGLELFDGHQFDNWVEKAIAPAIESSLKLYNELLELGFQIILLTGRSEGHRSSTVDNLRKAGFHSWEKLILRGVNDRGKPATVYKSEKRDEIITEGYRILGNSGDQWSDLLGSSLQGIRSFKLPNPMYYIS